MGLLRDTKAQLQPENSYRFMLNMAKDHSDATMGIVSSMSGNTKVVDSDNIVGHIMLNDQEVVLFTADNTISLFDGERITVLHQYQFGFSRNHPIRGVMRTVNGCERVVYWCDGLNEDRYCNIDRPERFTELSDFSFTPDVIFPNVSSEVTTGGNLSYGRFAFVVEILDDNENVVLRTLPQSYTSIGEGTNDDRPATNQQIILTLSNLDESFTAYRIGVLRFVSGDGQTPTAHYIGETKPIISNTITVNYPGYRPDAGESLVDFTTLLQPVFNYRTSSVMEEVHGRLLRANVSGAVYQYDAFQRAASRITTRYVIEEVSPEERFNRKTEQGDEIRDYGIIYVDRKGNLSQRYHIPGRLKLPTDRTLTSGELIGINEPVEQWRVVNTAGNGLLGYYESTELYQNPINYNGFNYWGFDDQGNSLLNTPVRYHKIPSRNKEILYDGENLRFIGIEFSNIRYPHPDIVGHIITANQVSPNSKVESGYITPFNDSSDATGDKIEGRYIHYLPGVDNERQSNRDKVHFITTSHLTQQRPVQGDILNIVSTVDHSFSEDRPRFTNILVGQEAVDLYGKIHTFSRHRASYTQLSVEDIIHLSPSTTFNGLTNRSRSSGFQVIDLETILPGYRQESANMFYAHLRKNTEPFPVQRDVQHQPITGFEQGSRTTVFGGNAFISKLDITNISHINQPDNRIFGVEAELLKDMYLETYEQFDRRHRDFSDCGTYYAPDKDFGSIELFVLQPSTPFSVITTVALSDFRGIVISRVFRKVEDGLTNSWQFRPGVCPEWYGYNSDYHAEVDIALLPLPYNYDFGSRCVQRYPMTIIYSQVGSDEGVNDEWRLFKALDSTTIPADRGEITAMDYYGNRLVVRTTYGCFVLSPNPQQVQLTDVTAFLGTASFLSIPAVELDGNGGGQQSVLGSVITPQGLFWCDEVTGKVYRFREGVVEVSRNGMYHFFEKTLRKPKNHPYGLLGAQMYYDPLLDMVFVTSQQYDPIESYAYVEPYYYRNEEIVNYRDKTKFRNNSFTISFDLREDVWRSFHSFIPNYGFYVSNRLFTQYNGIWIHESDTFADYYGIDFPVAVQYTYHSQQTSNWTSVHYYAQVRNGDTVLRDRTFDKAVAFTDLQTSDLVDLRLTRNPYEQTQWSAQTKNVIEADQNYRVGGLRSMSVDNPVHSDDWSLRQDYFIDGHGYIDHVPTNTNLLLPQHEQVYLRDKFLNLRLFFNDKQYQMLVFYVGFRNFPTLR